MRRLFFAIATTAALGTAAQDTRGPAAWGYGGGPLQIRYSPLTQISRANVAQLEVAWTYNTGEPGALQTQPVVVEDVLYGYTPTHKTFALNAATGEPLWTFAVRTAA
jgi:quinoprotein glucose dehydrogenase